MIRRSDFVTVGGLVFLGCLLVGGWIGLGFVLGWAFA